MIDRGNAEKTLVEIDQNAVEQQRSLLIGWDNG
jgi:hypothetical protein